MIKRPPLVHNTTSSIDTENEFVIPTQAVLAPEAGLPDEDFLLQRAQHDQDQSDGGRLRQKSDDYRRAAKQLDDAENRHCTFRQADTLAARRGVFEIVVAAVDKDEPDHQPERDKGIVRKLIELREEHAPDFGCRETNSG